MSPLIPKRRSRRPRRPALLSPRPRAAWAAPEPPPLTPQSAAPPPFPKPGPPRARSQKITLYAGAAIVVLIVIIIIALSSRRYRRPLANVPKGQTSVQVVDVRRFFASPIHPALEAAGHPIAAHLEAMEDDFNVSLRRDVAVLVDTDDSTLLIGRFAPKRMRDGFDVTIEKREKEINRTRQTPVQLRIHEADVEGYTYWYCSQEGVDHAFASVGRTVVCFGDRWGVRRFLKVRAGLRSPALHDERFAAAYDPKLARRALLYRIEKPDGTLLASRLRTALGDASGRVYAAFFAVAASEESIGLTIRFATTGADAATALESHLQSDAAQAALVPLLGTTAKPTITRDGNAVVLSSAVAVEKFKDIVANDKEGRGANLVLSLLIG